MTGHDKHNRNSASPLRRLIKAFGIGTEHGRECAKSDQRSRDNRRSEAGNVFFTLFGAVAIVGVLGAGIMSTMRGPLTTMVEVNRIEEAKSVIRLNSRLVLQNATQGDSALASPPDTRPAGEYCDDDDFTEAPFPDGGGISGGGTLPSNVGATRTDPWGTEYGYCAWNHGSNSGTCTNTLAGENSTTEVVIAIISAGPDRIFNTASCNDLYDGDAIGDDIATKVPYNDAAAMAGGGLSGGLWTAVGETGAEITRDIDVTGAGAFSGNLDVTGATTFTGVSNFGNNLITTGSVITNSIESTAQESGTIDIDGTITGGANGTLDINAPVDITGDFAVGGSPNTFTVASGTGNTAISGTLDVTGDTTVAILNATGATDLDSDLNVDGATTVTTLNATGAVDFESTLNVNGAISNDDATNTEVTIDDELLVTGAVDFDSTLNVDGIANFEGTITSDGDGIVNIDDALDVTGNTDIAGDLTVNTDKFTVDATDGDTTVGGDLTIGGDNFSLGTTADNGNGKIMVGQGAPNNNFAAVDMQGHATIAADGTLTIADNAVSGAKLDFGTGSNGDCVKLDGSVIYTESCADGGGGDGVGIIATDEDNCLISYEVSAGNYGWQEVSCDSLSASESDRIVDAAVAPATEGDTYIDVDTTNDGLTNSIVFYTNGTQRASISSDGVFRAGTTTGTEDGHRIGRFGIDYYESGNPIISSVTGNTINFEDRLRFVNDADISTRSTGHSDITLRNNSENYDIVFSTSTSDNSPVEVLRINAPGNVGIGTLGDPDASALLDLASTARGFLPPRMTEAERNAINSGTFATGLLVFNTEAGDSGLLQFWDGAEWVDVGGGGHLGGGQ